MNALWSLFQAARTAGWSTGELWIFGAALLQLWLLSRRMQRVERKQGEQERRLALLEQVSRRIPAGPESAI